MLVIVTFGPVGSEVMVTQLVRTDVEVDHQVGPIPVAMPKVSEQGCPPVPATSHELLRPLNLLFFKLSLVSVAIE
jgi:hypothetical protein